MKKKIFIAVFAVFAVVLSFLSFAVSFRADSEKKAEERLMQEISAMEEATEQINAENDGLRTEISAVNEEISDKDLVNGDYVKYKKLRDELEEDIEQFKAKSSDLDDEIGQKRAKLEGMSGVTEIKTGSMYALKKDQTYACPDGVPAGRYTAEGSGTMTVIASSGKARLSQNLDVAAGNSYTFNLSENEKIKVTGDVTLTELKEGN